MSAAVVGLALYPFVLKDLSLTGVIAIMEEYFRASEVIEHIEVCWDAQ